MTKSDAASFGSGSFLAPNGSFVPTGASSAETDDSVGNDSHQQPDRKTREWEYREFDRKLDPFRDPRLLYPLKWGYVDGSEFRRVEVLLGSVRCSGRAELVGMAEAKLHNTFPYQRQRFSREDQEKILEGLVAKGYEGWTWQTVKEKFGDSWPTDDEYDAVYKKN